MSLASSPELVMENVVLNEAKLGDVSSLLENRFGEDWKSQERLIYFKQLFSKANYKPTSKTGKESKEVVEDIDESDACSCCGEDEETFLL